MKTKITALILIVAALLCGCGGKPSAEVTLPSSQKTLTGTLDEVKDFMFIVTDDDGNSYAFPIDGETPQGFDQVSMGDRVTVTYTGTLSVVDNFTGDIISVEPSK